MKKKIFTLLVGISITCGLLKAQDVQIVDLASPNFTLEALNGATAEITKAPDGTDAIKVTLNSTAGWNGLASIKLNTPVALGQYVKIKFDFYSDLDKYKTYLKIFPPESTATIMEGWSGEDTENTWFTGELPLLDDQRDGSKTRKTGNIGSLLLIPGLGWSTNESAMDGKVAYYKNFRLEIGEDIPGPAQIPPTVFWKSYVSVNAININGLDADRSWDEPMDNYSVTSEPAEGVRTEGLFASCWDSQKLYFFVDVTDDNSVTQYGDANFVSWKGDGIQFYFDIFDRHFEATQGDQINGMAICPGMQNPNASDPTLSQVAAESKGYFGDYANDIELASTVSGSRYTMEFALPWHALYKAAKMTDQEIANAIRTEIKAGKKVGIGIQFNEFDPSKNDRIAAVNIPNASIWSKPMNWAQMELIGDGTPYNDPDYNKGPLAGISKVTQSKVNIYNVLGYINVTGENLKSVDVYTVSGQKIYTAAISENSITIPSASFSKGMYLVKVTDNNGLSITKKVIR